MTRRSGKGASERRSGIGDEGQPVMVRLAARWRRFNLVTLVTLRKGNHPGEALSEKGPKKSFVQKNEGLLNRAP